MRIRSDSKSEKNADGKLFSHFFAKLKSAVYVGISQQIPTNWKGYFSMKKTVYNAYFKYFWST